jgi:hypothetical protein
MLYEACITQQSHSVAYRKQIRPDLRNQRSESYVHTTGVWGIIVCSVNFVIIRYPSTDGLVRQQMIKEIVKMTREKRNRKE